MQTIQALIRFGLGRRGDEKLPSDPVHWLKSQITAEDAPDFPARMPTTADGLTVLREQFKLALPPGMSLVEPLYQQDLRAQTRLLLTTQAPFRERLVWFWANHFTVSIRQGSTNATIGPFIREAIRPNVTGPFFGMLLAVMRHPAMLMYLDNNNSFGPDSDIGKAQKRGLNENLARECLELHTLSPASGYTQADVTEFAKILTGWSVELNRLFPGYQFREPAHEPGAKTLLGRRFPAGEAGGIAALDYLAHHPATYAHLARRLVQHFVADEPPPDAVHRIETVLKETDGDLGQASLALVDLDAAWRPQAKLRLPLDYVVAVLRALNLPDDKVPLLQGILFNLGQPIWNAPLPNGWTDMAGEWAAPEAMLRRVDWAYDIAGRAADHEPMAVAENALGPLLNDGLRDAVRRAASRREGLALLLGSPEFQRR